MFCGLGTKLFKIIAHRFPFVNSFFEILSNIFYVFFLLTGMFLFGTI